MISTCNNRIIDLLIVALMCPIPFEWTCMLPTWQFSHKIPNSILKHGIYKPCYFGAGTLLNGTPLNRPPPTIYQKKFDMLCHLDDIENNPDFNKKNLHHHSLAWMEAICPIFKHTLLFGPIIPKLWWNFTWWPNMSKFLHIKRNAIQQKFIWLWQSEISKPCERPHER